MVTATEQQAEIPEARRKALLAAAAEVFFKVGFAKARIDDVIAIAGGSKRNIYEGFGGKEGMFEALIDSRIEACVAAIEASRGEGTGIEERLVSFGERITEILFSPAMIGIFRAIIPEGAQMQSPAERFYELAPRRATERMAEILAAARENGELELANPMVAADQLIALLRGTIHIKLLLGLRGPVSSEELSEHVRASVGIFLDGCRRDGRKR